MQKKKKIIKSCFSGSDQNKMCILMSPAASNKCLSYSDDIFFGAFWIFR